MLWNGVIGRGEGIALFTGILAYTIFQLVLAKKEKNPEVLAEFIE